MTPASQYPRKEFLAHSARLFAVASGALALYGRGAWTRTASAAAEDSIAMNAVQAAREFKGVRLRFTPVWGWEQAEEPRFASRWAELTGVQVELDRGFGDVFEVRVPSIPDFAERGWIVPLDRFIAKHKAAPSLEDYDALNRTLTRYRGKTWGFVDDGDVWPVYYRKDVFADSDLRSAYRDEFGRDLRVPRRWDEFAETAQFITQQRAPKLYGTGMARELVGDRSHFYFHFHFLHNGGHFFDPATMRATINDQAGVRAIAQILAENRASVPAVERLDSFETHALWLEGRIAMMTTWPPLARASEGGRRDRSFERWMPTSKVAGKVGYTTIGRTGFTTGGFAQCVGGESKHREAAYLFAQWLTSPSVSLDRLGAVVLRDPSRVSHYRSEQFRSRWPHAGELADALCKSANWGVLPLIITGVAEYDRALDDELYAIQRGRKGVQRGLDDAAAQWDRITKKLGVEKQRRSYQSFLKLTGSSRETTAAAKGLAVRC